MTQIVNETIRGRQPTVELLDLFPWQGEWTEDDYFNLPDTSRIIELSEGRLIIPDMPTDEHQKISLKLSFALYSYVSKHNIGEVRYSPLPMRLWKDKIREPDIVFMNNSHKDRISDKYWGVPDLAIEILSKSTSKSDRVEKFYEYVMAGILEYWIVDPFKHSIEVFSLDNGAYELFGKWGVGEIAKSKLLTDFDISIDEIMA